MMDMESVKKEIRTLNLGPFEKDEENERKENDSN